MVSDQVACAWADCSPAGGGAENAPNDENAPEMPMPKSPARADVRRAPAAFDAAAALLTSANALANALLLLESESLSAETAFKKRFRFCGDQ